VLIFFPWLSPSSVSDVKVLGRWHDIFLVEYINEVEMANVENFFNKMLFHHLKLFVGN